MGQNTIKIQFSFIFSLCDFFFLELKLTVSNRNISMHETEVWKTPQLQANYKQITSYTDHETNSVTFHF